MVPIAALMLISSPLAARIGRRLESRVPLQAGVACATLAFPILAAAHTRLWHFYLAGAAPRPPPSPGGTST